MATQDTKDANVFQQFGLLSVDMMYNLLRAVVDGDEKARLILKDMLDCLDESVAESGDLPTEEDDENTYHWLFLKNENEARELHFRIKLNYTEYKIWRELKVPYNMRLDTFAEVLLEAMGWAGEHLYQLRDGETTYCTKDEIENGMMGRGKCVDMSEVCVGDVFSEKGKHLKFEYDFGDGWEHDVWLKGEREYEKGEKPVVACFKGQGMCPPENCGGVWGYQELIELSHKKRLTKAERERLEWFDIDKGYDPDAYDPDLYEFEQEMIFTIAEGGKLLV